MIFHSWDKLDRGRWVRSRSLDAMLSVSCGGGIFTYRTMSELLQLCVYSFALLKDGDVRVGVLPKGEEAQSSLEWR
jgi:hypothetical protein